jgi:hypothetical protein
LALQDLNCGGSGLLQRFHAASDYQTPTVRNLAADLAGRSPGEFNVGQVCAIYDHLHSQWRYVNDPQREEFLSSASNTLAANLSGDCDDFALLMNALLTAIGGHPRICLGWNRGGSEGHAFCEVLVGNATETTKQRVRRELLLRYGAQLGSCCHYRVDAANRLWLNLDWNAHNPGGPYYEHTEGVVLDLLDASCDSY